VIAATATRYIRGQWDLFGNWRRGVRSIARDDWATLSQRLRAIQAIRPLAGLRMLDIGCGQRCKSILVYRAFGAQPTGIDLEPGRPDLPLLSYVAWSARHLGAERALKTLVRRGFFERAYFQELERCAGRKLLGGALDVRRMDAQKLDFPNATFDAVTSDQVWEHVADVERATSEIGRVLKPGGLVSMTVALFPSLPGGHHYSWLEPDERPSSYVEPWDHLRSRKHPAFTYLNEYRQADFRSVFDRHFDILDWDASRQVGRKQLTPGIRAELADFTEEDLLTPQLVLLARKPRASVTVKPIHK